MNTVSNIISIEMRVEFVVSICLLMSLCTADANTGPNNTAVVSGTSVQMHCGNTTSCKTPSDESKNNIYWTFFSVVGSTRVDFRKTPPERVSFNKTCDGQFDVIINQTEPRDAGEYKCVLPTGRIHTAQLIVLDSEPRCLSSSFENDEDAIHCTVNFNGKWSPVMKWQTVGGLELPGHVVPTPNNVTSILKRSTMKIIDEAYARFKCQTYFELKTNKSLSTDFTVVANNTPAYHYEWISDEIKIPPRDHFAKSTQPTNEVNKHATTRLPDGIKPEDHSTLIAIMISLFLIVIAFITTVTAIYFVKKYKKRKPNRNREVPRSVEYYAEVSQRGNMSMDNGSLQLNSVAFQQYDEVSLSTRGPPHYPQYRHFDEDDIAAYSETRTIASIPAIIKSGKSALSLDKHIPESGSFEAISRPSVDSAMPVYAEVQKSKNLRKYENDSSSSKWSDATSDRSNGGVIDKVKPKEEHENVGADGTEYVKVTDKSRDRKKIPLPKDLPKKTKEEAIYIGVDHTRRKPPPPPPFY